MTQSEKTTRMIDGWWRNGKPSNVVEEAGVLVRQLDELVRRGFHEWEPCPQNMWCGKFSTIWPSSLINKDYNKALYCGSAGARRESPAVGFVLAPPPVNRFYCIYPSDANSMNAMEQEMKGRVPHASHACGKTCRPPDEMHYCSFRDDNLSLALEANANYGFDSRFKYNEVIVDAERMKAALPRSLLGVFYMDEETREQARNIHQQFLETFNVGPGDFPLMAFSLTEGFRVGS